jgi:hypothetical protein
MGLSTEAMKKDLWFLKLRGQLKYTHVNEWHILLLLKRVLTDGYKYKISRFVHRSGTRTWQLQHVLRAQNVLALPEFEVRVDSSHCSNVLQLCG